MARCRFLHLAFLCSLLVAFPPVWWCCLLGKAQCCPVARCAPASCSAPKSTKPPCSSCCRGCKPAPTAGQQGPTQPLKPCEPGQARCCERPELAPPKPKIVPLECLTAALPAG